MILVPKSDEMNDEQCLPMYMYKIIQCTMAQIFLTCPSITVNNDCDEVKKTVEDCVKDGTIMNMYSFVSKILFLFLGFFSVFFDSLLTQTA